MRGCVQHVGPTPKNQSAAIGIGSTPASQPSHFQILAYPIWVSWMIGEPELEGKQSSDIIFGVVAFVGRLQAFILADGKTGVSFIPDMEGPDGDYLKWSRGIYNGIFEIK